MRIAVANLIDMLFQILASNLKKICIIYKIFWESCAKVLPVYGIFALFHGLPHHLMREDVRLTRSISDYGAAVWPSREHGEFTYAVARYHIVFHSFFESRVAYVIQYW